MFHKTKFIHDGAEQILIMFSLAPNDAISWQRWVPLKKASDGEL